MHVIATAEALEPLPEGSILEQVGQVAEGPGGTWVAGAFRVGPCHWYAAAVPVHDQRGAAVCLAIPYTDKSMAAAVADGLAAVAAR